MADKFDATFHGMTDEDMRTLIQGLQQAEAQQIKRRKIIAVGKNVLTTMIITLGFTVCLLVLGMWGYIPAMVGTTSYFTRKDLKALKST